MAKLGLQQSPLEAALQQAESVSYGLPDDLKKQFEQDRIKAESRRKNTDQQYDARVLDLSSRNAAVTGGATWDSKLAGSTSFIQNNPDVFAGYSPQQMHWIAAISAQESAGNPNARSPVGAFGLMQVMPATGQNPGYGIKPLRDSSVRENVRLGLGKFEAMMSRFNGDVDKALAAYNAGEGNVDKAVARARKYGGDWKAYLPRPQETIPYINNVKGYYNAIGSKGGVPTSAAQPAPTKQATTADSRYRPLSETELKRMQEAQAQGLDTFVPFAGAKPIKIGQQPGKKAPKQENEDAGFLSDTGNLLLSGISSSAEAAREISSRIPGVRNLVGLMDQIDQYFTGKTSQQIFDEAKQKYEGKLSPDTAGARKKLWIVEPGDKLPDGTTAKNWDLGDAWKDPRAYYAGVVESLPEMAITMGGSMTLAKGAFKRAIASGATREVAAKKAATTATIAGGLLEGSFGGAHASGDVRKEIKGMSADMLKNSDVMKALMAEGKTFDQARNQLAEDAATKAFVLAGVGTGIFGGMGDRALAQIITKGTSGRLKSAARGAVAEGLLEEMPQSALQQMAHNYAVQDADPNRPLSKGVANAAAGGAVLGGIMGGGIGAVAHRGGVEPVPDEQTVEEVPQAAAEAPVQDAVPEQLPRNVGPLERALGGEESLNTAIDNEIAAVAADQWLGAPGTVTKISPKADPESVYTVTVEGYENGEVFARDQDGTPMQFSQGDVNVAQPTSETITPAAQVDATEQAPTERRDGTTDIIKGGMTIVHGSGNDKLSLDDIKIIRTNNQKQGKKGRVYGGFYGTSEVDSAQAEGYASMMGGSPTLYDVKIKAGTKVLKKTGDVTRLSENYINELVAQGYGVVVGKDPRGRTEYVVIDKNAIESMNARPGKNTGTEQGHAPDLTDFDYTPKQPTKAAEDPNLSTFDTTEGQSVNPEPVKKVEIEQAEKNLGKMTKDELDARMQYLVTQAKTNGGWTKRLMSERNKVEKALANLAKAQHQVEENQKPPTTADAIKHGMAEISRGMDEGARNQVAEYIREGNTDRLTYRKEDAINAALSNPNYNVQRNDDGSVTVIGVKTADGAWHGVARDDATTKNDASKTPSFDELFLDAHVNNPAQKTRLIQAEIKNSGRTRSQVLADVKRIVDAYEAGQTEVQTEETAKTHPLQAKMNDAVQRYNDAVDARNQANEQGFFDEAKRQEQIALSADKEVKAIKRQYIADVQESTLKAEQKKVENIANEYLSKPIGYRYRPSEYEEERGLYWEKTASNEWTGRGDWFQKGKTRTNIDMAKAGGLIEVPSNAAPVTTEATTDMPAPLMGADGNPKWFMSQDKAQAHIEKQKLVGQYEVKQVDSRRFEIHPIAAGTQEAAQSNAAPTVAKTETVQLETKQTVTQWKEDMQEALAKADQEHPLYKKLALSAKNGLRSEHDREVALRQAREIEKQEQPAPKSKPSDFIEVISVGGKKAPTAEQVVQKSIEPKAETDQFADNKLFTADKVAAARARLKSKFGRLNSGIDPEVLIDGMTIAGAYIESGVRKFSDYSKAMIEDLGDGVKPYLLSFWEGARNYPGLDTTGMTSVEDSAKEHAALLTPADVQTEAVGQIADKPKTRTKKTGSKGDMVLTQDWGVEHIDGYSQSNDREIGNDTKDAFLKETRNYLNAVADALRTYGFEPHLDSKGKPEKPVNVNESGMAGSGDVSLVMQNPDNGNNVYITIGDTSLRGVVPTTPSGIAIMYRVGQNGDRYATRGTNTWSPVDLSANDLAKLVNSRVRPITTTEESQNARTVQSNELSAGNQSGVQENATTGNRDSEPMATGVAETSSSADRSEPVSNGTQGTGGSGARGVQQREQPSPSTSRDSGSLRTDRSTADAVADPELLRIRAREEYQKKQSDAFKKKYPLERILDIYGKQNDDYLSNDSDYARGFNVDSERYFLNLKGVEIRIFKVEGYETSDYLRPSSLIDKAPFVTYKRPVFTQERSDIFEWARENLTEQETPAAKQADPATAEKSPKPEIDQPSDFDLKNEDIGKGGLTKKYKDNIAAIRILKAMDAEGRVATPEERKAIARYVGWGALKGVFDKENKQWSKEYAELKDLLTDAEYKAARASTLNAHYTSPTVVGGIFKALEQLGFTTGRVLEPSVGTGNFFGLMPAAMRKKSQLHGVELDPLTSQIAAALYPSAKIAKATGFQDFQVPAEYFDLAIGNPPFGSEPIVDNDRSPYSGASIHNYFFAKSIDKLRPGGLLAMVVSHNFMDANNEATRKWIADRADLVSAVRLPRTAFKENAGTDVVTDILVFRKRGADDAAGDMSWVKTGKQTLNDPKSGNDVEHRVSSYFLNNPDKVLGTPSAAGSMYRAAEYTVEPSGDLEKQLTDWASSLPQNMYKPIERTHEQEAADVSVPDGVKVGSYFVGEDGKVLIRGQDVMGSRTATEWTAPNAKAAKRMKGMIGLRDALREQMRLEKSSDATEKQIEDNRTKLNSLYDDFKKQYGFLNDQTNRRIFLDDTESALLLALEFDYDKGVSEAVAEREEIEQRPPSAVKADIFNRRVMFPPADNIKVSNANDALLASLNYKARLDLPYMASLYDKTESEIINELGDVVFNDPLNGYVMADEYLSGDVKTKLVEAEQAAKDNPDFKRNVEALKKVIPADKLPSEIHAAMGANFIPAELFEQFAKEVTGADYKIAYIKATGQWVIDTRGGANASLNVGKWGIAKMPATSIFARTMAGQGVVVTETIKLAGGGTQTRVLEKETEAAREKQAAMKAEWQRWLWSDPDRADRVASIYNEKMNRIVVRKYDGSHMTFPGMSPAMELLPHQKNAVWRALQSRQVLFDHVVGAGKTFEVVALFMEMRRLGIARKPFIAVPNHLTLQWRSEFSRLYPAANVLAATPEDFSKGNREKFFSKIVTGDWDAVIVGHSSLKKIALPPETEKSVLEEQINEIAESIEEIKRARGDRNIIRDMEGIKARLEARMKTRIQNLGERDKVVTFDELGVDAFAIDELHEFKNLFYNSTMERVPGMGNPSGSDKAFDLFVKLQWMFNTFGDKAPIAGATGTPVSNSLVEMFNMQRLLQYPMLKKEGLHVFDAWAKQFGSVESLYEVSPSGTGYRQSSRFAKFKNLPALMSHYQTFADTVTLDDLKAQEEARGKAFPVPKVAGGRPQNIVAKRSPDVASFMGTPELDIRGNQVQFGFNIAEGDEWAVTPSKDGDFYHVQVLEPQVNGESVPHLLGTAKTEEDARLMLVEQALSPKIYVDPESILGQFANLKELNKKTKGKVNALSLTGQANKAGLDYRLINPNAPDFAGSKINMAVDRMMETYKKWDADKGTQLVFCDLSVPKSARSGYSAKERRAYVRDEKGALTHKKATLHTAEGFEDLPFLVVKEAKTFVIYDAATGLRIRGDLPSKAVAVEWSKETLSDDAKRQRWIDARDSIGDLDQDAIDDYNNANEIDTEETEAISLIDIAGASGAADFSVYDDIKAKLIAKGVPEREIAFIHDYSTPVAKEKLFKAVNAGTIRFLIGSTPKMGAGTNVQKRLVGLHHIDAPWRPSDLEQREGRIIRRGNTLYERDPSGFEVEIYRYATEQTYDTRRWQILEHKSRGIEQLRNYDGTTNEIDDIEGEAANAADMKAAASGDPLILEETQLRNDVRRLESLQAAHADSTQMMFRRARDNQRFADEVGPRALEEHQKLLATAEMHPVKKDQFVGVTVEGRSFTDRDESVKAIQKQLVRVFSGERDATFNYRGIEFTIENTLGYVELNSPTGRLDSFDPSKDSVPSAAGFLTRFANYINRLPAHIDDLNAKIAEAKQSAVDMREQANAPFAQADELTAAREAHKRVQRRLIAKGPDIPANQKPLLESAMEKQKDALRHQGLGDALDEFIGSRQFSRNAGSFTGVTVEQVRDTLSDRFGAKTIAKLEKNGILTIVEAYDEPDVEGFTHGGKVTLVANALTSDTIVPVFLHELGGHVGMQGVMKPDAYKSLMDQFNRLVAAKDPIALDAKRLAEREKNPTVRQDEYLPYMITVAAREQKKRPGIRTLINRIVAAVKAWAFEKIGVNINLNANDVLALAERMVNTISKGKGTGSRLFSRADQTSTPEFKKWFGDSKVVDSNGKPLVVYHGTDADFTQFDASYDGYFGSGIYLTGNIEDAEQYGDNTMSLYAKIEKPYQTVADYEAGEEYDLESPAVPMILDLFGEDADAIIERLQDGDDTVGGEIQEKLIEKGYDGVQIDWGDGLTQYVAVSPEQIKSATDNTGAFDANNPDIRFSRRDEDLAPVSEQEYASKLSQWWSEAKKLPSDKLTKLMTDGGLGLIPLRPMLTEMAKDIPAATSYLRIKDAMDAMRNKWHAKTDAVAQEWLKYRIKNKGENRELMDLMHESTLNQVDPSMPFQSLMTPKERMALQNPNLNANLRLELTAKMELDAKREEAYDVLKSRYDSLSSEAQSLYKSVRDTYTDLADAFDETLLKNMEKAINVRVKKAEREHSREMERITDEGLQGQERDDAIAAADRRLKNAKTKIAWNRKARITQLRKQFETQRLAGPYFPLARFGNLFVTVRDAKSGEVVSFSRFEDPTEQRQFAEEMRKDKNYKVEEGALIGEAAVRKAVDPNFVADVEDILADLPNAEQVKDEVWQRYLESLPDMSVRKSRIHRKGRAGFNADAVRAFGHHMFHGSHQLARMAHSMDLEDALDQAKDDARTSKDPKRSSLIVNEMEKRHQFIMNPTGGALAQWASSFAFVWYLAGSPKAAIMNLFQTPIMATPILGAYAGGLNGVARAGKELIKAAIDFTKGKGFAGHSSSLTAEERQAMADGYETGVIERTQGHDLAGVGETGVEYSAARERAMKIISWGFHHAERFNREVTFLAAYRLARTKGLSHESAVNKAGELTWKSHFDYSNTSRPRLMHSDTMKVLLVFRNFQINMLYRLFRDVHQAVNGESKEVRREALTHLAGITGMMMLNAGITGTWLFGIAMVMAGLFMEDGEKPDEELKKAMIKVLGPRLAGMALHGLPGYITGTSLSGSVGMPDLWFRSPDSEKEGEEALQYWQSQLLGAVPGIAAQFVSGWDKIKKGEEYRGIETMMPKMFKDPMKAYRYMTEGAKNMRGDTVTEVTNPDVIKQALGFTPARIAEQYKINNASYNLQQTIMKERKRIMDDYYKADQEGDEAKVNELIKKIEKYNEKNPEQAITPRSIIQSRKNRDKGAENAVGGMRYNSKLRDRLMEEQAPNIYGE